MSCILSQRYDCSPGGLLKEGPSQQTIRKKSTLREYAEAAAIAVLIALFIRAFVVQAFKIPSGSMEPTLLVGDHILVNKFIYGIKTPFFRKTIVQVTKPEREDVIVFIFPKDETKDFIKRVIGIPGELIQIIDDKIFVNGMPYQDTHGYYSSPMGNDLYGKRNFGPVRVPENHYFVMGDNRDNSDDSRRWGFVPSEFIKGEAFIIYWSWPHWSRFLQTIN